MSIELFSADGWGGWSQDWNARRALPPGATGENRMPSPPVRIFWESHSKQVEHGSPFTYQSKVYVGEGTLRKAVLEFPCITLPLAKLWMSWLGTVNGRAIPFQFQDPAVPQTAARIGIGQWVWTVRIDGSGQQGRQVISTKGWPVSTAGVLKTGDWVSIRERLYNILEDADSDAAGDADVTIWPPLHPDAQGDASVFLHGAGWGWFRIIDTPDITADVEALMHGFAIAIREVTGLDDAFTDGWGGWSQDWEVTQHEGFHAYGMVGGGGLGVTA